MRSLPNESLNFGNKCRPKNRSITQQQAALLGQKIQKFALSKKPSSSADVVRILAETRKYVLDIHLAKNGKLKSKPKPSAKPVKPQPKFYHTKVLFTSSSLFSKLDPQKSPFIINKIGSRKHTPKSSKKSAN